MATHIKADGTKQTVTPANGHEFTLEEIRGYIGGYLEGISLTTSLSIYLDEEGRLKNKPYNEVATHELWKYRNDHRISRTTLVGDVLIASTRETGDEE